MLTSLLPQRHWICLLFYWQTWCVLSWLTVLLIQLFPLQVDRTKKRRKRVAAGKWQTGLLVMKSVQTLSSSFLWVSRNLGECHLLSLFYTDGSGVIASRSLLQVWEFPVHTHRDMSTWRCRPGTHNFRGGPVWHIVCDFPPYHLCSFSNFT